MSVTLAMIVISVAIYVIINFIDHSDEKSALAIKYGAFYPPKIEYKQEYWRFLTANFVHVDLVHIFMNCYALYYLGGTFFGKFRIFVFSINFWNFFLSYYLYGI